MENQSLNRREFLRLSIVVAGGAVMAACQDGQPNRAPAATKGTMTPSEKAGIQFHGSDADVWAFSKQIDGSIDDPGACQAVRIHQDSWSAVAHQQDSSFSAEVPIRPGANKVRAVCEGADGVPGVSAEITLMGRLTQRPTAVIHQNLSNGLLRLDGSGSLPDELENQPIREYVWTAGGDNPAVARVDRKDFTAEIVGPRIGVELAALDGEYYFSLRVIDEAGREDSSTTYVVVENGKLRIPDYDHENTAWVEKAIVYGVIPRLFGTPGAEAIQYKLDELAELGINAMWLAPINETNDYGYSVIDYFELRGSFGSKEDFKALIDAAHARGIRVLMDFVPNHTSDQHPYFKDAVEKGQDSPYWDFYDRDENGKYTYYFDWTHLPNLNYDNPEVHRMMIEAFSYWVREFDVDGFRVDACWGVQQRRPDFWPEWRREMKRIKPDLLLLAEASARDPFNFDHGFDAAYDWTENLGQWAWGRFWSDQAEKVDTAQQIKLLKDALMNGPQGYHHDALIFRFLNNNDTRTRFIATHGEPLTRVATALLLTLPGLPCIYTADELGQSFLPYDSGLISWRERYRGLRDYHKKLIALRKEIPSLHSRQWQLLDVEPADQVLGYIRYLAGEAEPVLVLLNFSEEPASVSLLLPEAFSALAETGLLSDQLNDEDLPFSERSPIPMAPMGARILTPNKDGSQA